MYLVTAECRSIAGLVSESGGSDPVFSMILRSEFLRIYSVCPYFFVWKYDSAIAARVESFPFFSSQSREKKGYPELDLNESISQRVEENVQTGS